MTKNLSFAVTFVINFSRQRILFASTNEHIGNLTRKMVEFSLVLPKFLREKKGLINKILRLEQEGQHLHQILNAIERTYKSVKNKQERYWLMLESYENKLYCTK